MKTKRLGIFIDLEIINNPELDWENKVLLAEIISLSKLEKGCIASNQTLADFLQIKRQSIHRRIKFLVDNGYITTINKFSGKRCVGRIIYPTGKLMSAQASIMEAHADNMEAHADINDSTGFHSMTAGSDPIYTINNSSNSVINTEYNTSINTDEFFDIEEELDKILNKQTFLTEHIIDAFENNIKEINTPTEPPTQPPSVGGTEPTLIKENETIINIIDNIDEMDIYSNEMQELADLEFKRLITKNEYE